MTTQQAYKVLDKYFPKLNKEIIDKLLSQKGVRVKEFRKDGHHLIDYTCPACKNINKIIYTGEKKFSCSCEFDKIIDSMKAR